jgi:hypothetical protein
LRTLPRIIGCCLLVGLTTTGFAQSSGNTNWNVDQTQCSMSCQNNDCIANPVTGFSSTGVAKISTTIQTPTSGSTAIIIRPSAVTGLFTNTKTTSTTLASAEASVNVSVKLDGNPIPGLSSVVYDQRLQQLSTNIFQNLNNTTCSTDPNTGVTTCTCTGGQTCNIDLALATLSAHSYDFVVGNPNANGTNNHTVEVDFALNTPSSGSGSTAAACVGPVSLTVEQVKAFQQNFN